VKMHESMLAHHAWHIVLTLVALAAIGAWWKFQKRNE